MTDYRNVLERDLARVGPAPFGLDDVARRRDRKRRNQRIAAGVVGMAVFVAAVWIVTSGGSLDRSQTAVVPGGTGPVQTGPVQTGPVQTGPVQTGPVQTGPVQTGPAETGPAETGPAETGPTAPLGESSTDYLLDLDTGETTPLPEAIRGDWQNGYALSPDGSEVAYYGEGADTNFFGSWAGALFVAHIDGTHVRQIADDAFVVGGGTPPT